MSKSWETSHFTDVEEGEWIEFAGDAGAKFSSIVAIWCGFPNSSQIKELR